jgi:hypothetical protein
VVLDNVMFGHTFLLSVRDLVICGCNLIRLFPASPKIFFQAGPVVLLICRSYERLEDAAGNSYTCAVAA